MEKITKILLKESLDIWEKYLTHPFITGIGDGSLDREKFCYYTVQDYLYLLNYSKIFALGVCKAEDEAMMRDFARYLQEILNSEMGIHFEYLKKYEINHWDLAQTKKANLVNISYTNYMISKAYEGGQKEVLCILAACALSYEFIARHLLANHPCNDDFYAPWVKAYASEEYSKINHWLSLNLDKYSNNIDKKALDNLVNIFRNCSLYEYDFWQASWEMRDE